MDFELIESPSAIEIAELNDQFSQFVKCRYPNLPPESEDRIFMVKACAGKGDFVGGIYANCYWNGLEIETLWVAESHRGQGLGAKLVRKAESFGFKHGAAVSFLKTVNARSFYEQNGYEVYGILEDRPLGSVLYHMKKRLK